MKINDLDGIIEVTYSYTVAPGWRGHDGVWPLTQAVGVICNGRFVCVDVGGCTAVGSIKLLGDSAATYECVWDASRADADVTLTQPDGQRTRGQVAYSATLNLTLLDHTFIADGEIPLGPITIKVAVRRLAGLEN